jgi:hypothetical protein
VETASAEVHTMMVDMFKGFVAKAGQQLKTGSR